MTGIKILALVGSLRAGSVNRQIAELAAEMAPAGVTVTVFDGLGEVPFYLNISCNSVAASVVNAKGALPQR